MDTFNMAILKSSPEGMSSVATASEDTDNVSEASISGAEAEHAKQLIVMEQEARIRHINLSRKIARDHYLVEKNMKETITKMEDRLKDQELDQSQRAQDLELEIIALTTRMRTLPECRTTRIEHFKSTFGNVVNRYNRRIGVVRQTLQEVRAKAPKVSDELNKLMEDRHVVTNSAKAVADLIKRLTRVREDVSGAIMTMLSERVQWSRDQRNGDHHEDKLSGMNEELKKVLDDKKEMMRSDERKLDDLAYVNDQLFKEMAQLTASDIDDEAATLRDEMVRLRSEIHGATGDDAGFILIVEEADEYREHLKPKLEERAAVQARCMDKERATMALKHEEVDRRLAELAEEEEALPWRLEEMEANSRRRCDEQEDELRARLSSSGRQLRMEVLKAQADEKEKVDKLEGELESLNERMKERQEAHQRVKTELEAQIRKLSDAIPSLATNMR
jgi:hypothetical protein